MFHEEKATALAYFLVDKAGGSLPHKKLMKLLYLVEREYLRVKGLSVTSDRFLSLDEGPVLSGTYDCMKRTPNKYMLADAGNVWRQYLTPIQGFKVRRHGKLDVSSVLTPPQLKVAGEVWDEYGSKSEEELIEYTHTLKEWRDPSGHSLPIEYEQIFEGLGIPGPIRKERIARLKNRQRIDKAFNAA